jgi:hypothetical protein
MSPEAVYFFNREDVDQVVHEGYVNEEEKQFSDSYDDLIVKTDIVKGTVDNSESSEPESFGF